MSIAWAAAAGDVAVGHDAQRVLPAASTIKVAIALALSRAAVAGTIDLATRPTIGVVGDGALLDDLPGLAPTLAHCSTLMLAVSDNAATNAILGVVGFDAVQAECDRLGLPSTRVRRLMGDRRAAADGRDNVTSAADLARLMASLTDPWAVAPAVAAPVLAGLRASHHRDLIGEALAASADEVLPKSGELDDARHDAALVRVGGREVGLAVCSHPRVAPPELRQAARTALAALLAARR